MRLRSIPLLPARVRSVLSCQAQVLALLLAGCLAGIASGAYAQSDTVRLQPAELTPAPISPAAQARAGLELLRQDRPEAARSVLQDALAADTALMLPEHGAVAYWLGDAFARTGDTAAARTAWRRGMRALEQAGRFDVRLADAALRSLTQAQLRERRLQVVRRYRRLLAHVGSDTSDAARAIFRRRVAQLAPLLPDDVFAATVDGTRDASPATWTFRPSAGEALLRWGRGLDPFPATPENERLEEHVTRLIQAERRFRCPENPSTLDARGRAYLRFGRPHNRHDLSYKNGEFFREVFRFGVPIPASGFPEGELWLYPQIDEAAYYLFVEADSGCFEVATANDLLPSTLRHARADSERGLNIAYSSLMAQRAIYQELALYHGDFSGRYSEIANYADWQELKATAARAGFPTGSTQQTTVGAGVGQTRVVSSDPVLGIPPPTQFVRRLVARAEREDRQAARRREEVMPRQHTELRDDTPTLPVAVRTARFLEEDGTTRTDVYWGLPSAEAALRDSSGHVPSTIVFAITQSDSSRVPQARHQRRYHLPATPTERGGFVPSPISLENPGGRYHLSLQWTQYRRWERAKASSIGPKRRLTLARADSLRPLRARGPLEMSDVMVRSVPDTVTTTPAAMLDEAVPYPFRTVTPETPLLLSFELYHLAQTAEDRSRYTVSYEVRGRTRRDWTRLIRGQDTQQTTAETTVQSARERVDEQILLDLSEIGRDEAQDVRVTVRVTDEVTGATASRSLDFVLRPKDES